MRNGVSGRPQNLLLSFREWLDHSEIPFQRLQNKVAGPMRM